MLPAGGVNLQTQQPTAQANDPSHVGFEKLPAELLYHIFRLAASTDYKTAHACAYVSKLICRWTAPDRWRTIICTSGYQLEALWEALETSVAVPSPHGPDRGKRPISWPGPQPGAFVENLFIDTSGAEWRIEDLVHSQEDMESCLSYACPRLSAQDRLTYSEQHKPHPVDDLLRHFQHVNYLALGFFEARYLRLDAISPAKLLCVTENESFLINFIDQMGPHLSEDPNDPLYVDDALWRADGSQIWKPSLETFRRRLDAVHFIGIERNNELSGVTMPAKNLEALRAGSFGESSLVRRIADHQEGGLPPRLSQTDQEEALASKWYIWPREDRKGERRYIRGSYPLSSPWADLQPENRQTSQPSNDVGPHPFDNEYGRINPTSWSHFQQGVTKIRYDTRKFALRPAEITASRLKPFFEELTTTRSDFAGLSDISGVPKMSAPYFTHSGPRHAAPHRGAGHYSKPDPGAYHDRTIATPKQAALNTFGCSKFQSLHLCWDPVPSTVDAANGVKAGKGEGSDAGSLSLASGAVEETDWPVERQDIWTNTSSQNNEAQAPPPHTTPSRAKGSLYGQNGRAAATQRPTQPSSAVATAQRQSWIIPSSLESRQSKNFRVDLIDSIRTTYGWTRQDLLLSEPPSDSQASNLVRRLGGDVNRFNRFDRVVSEIAHQQSSIHDRDASSSTSSGPYATARSGIDEEKLTIRVVPPAERLKLGGMYVPYTKEQRIKWFLANLDTDDA